MKILELVQKVQGTQTFETVKDSLQVSKGMTLYYLHRLKKQGYLKTKRLSNNRRLYTIGIENKLGGKSYIEVINQYAPLKIRTTRVHRIYGKEITEEEALMYAIQTKSIRIISASLALFKKIDQWTLLYQLAKKNNVERQVGALYDLAKKMMKIRRMTQRFRNHALPKRKDTFQDIIQGLHSKDFKEIEKIWKVHLPFNKEDLEDYR